MTIWLADYMVAYHNSFISRKVDDVVVTVPFPKQVLNVNLTPSGE